MTTEIYYVNRTKYLLEKMLDLKNIIFSKRRFSLITEQVFKKVVSGQHIYNKKSGSRIEFLLFNFQVHQKDYIIERFTIVDSHERIHRFVSETFGLHAFKGEEGAIRKMDEYAFNCEIKDNLNE